MLIYVDENLRDVALSLSLFHLLVEKKPSHEEKVKCS